MKLDKVAVVDPVDLQLGGLSAEHLRLFGGPYENNRYLGTLFQLDKAPASNCFLLELHSSSHGYPLP